MERDRRDAREDEQQRAAEPAPAPMAHAAILGLQQSAGNAAVTRLLRAPAAAPKALNALKVNHEQVTVPPDAGLELKATVDPSDAGGEIKYGVASAGVTLDSGTTADAATGKITVSDKQVGGKAKATVEQKITAEDGAYTTQPADRQISFIDEPGKIASTSATAASTAAAYQGDFTHTFTPGPGGAAGLERGRVNERFGGPLIKDPMSKTHTIASPFGSFTLTANDPASTSAGWELNSSGEMGSADHVSISKNFVDAREFIVNAAKPTAKGLPQEFELTQNFHSLRYPGKTYGATAVASTTHKRTLRDAGTKLEVALAAGGEEVVEDYVGPAVYRKATASAPTVEASTKEAPKTVQVSVEALGKAAVPTYTIVGEALGSKVDTGGLVTIGDKPGVIKVRAGDATSYDEVSITITAPAKPAGVAPTSESGSADGAPALVAPPSE